jgi:hypothetical protein
MVHDGDGGAGGAGESKLYRLVYTRFLVVTSGGPFRPSNMPLMNIKTAEGFMVESNCFYTFFTTCVAKRVHQIRIAIDRYNRTAAEKINLAVDVDGSDYVIIFPGRTSHKDNGMYKKIAMAKTLNNPSYWTWSAHVGMPEFEEEQTVVQIDEKQVREELEDELAMVNVETKRIREELEAELADSKRARVELEAQLATVNLENHNLRDKMEKIRFYCG